MIYVFIFQKSDSLLIWISDRGNYNFAGADNMVLKSCSLNTTVLKICSIFLTLPLWQFLLLSKLLTIKF